MGEYYDNGAGIKECPVCGSTNVETISTDFDNEYIYRIKDCIDCGCEYEIEYCYMHTEVINRPVAARKRASRRR